VSADTPICEPPFDVVELAPHVPPAVFELFTRSNAMPAPSGPAAYWMPVAQVEPAFVLPATPPNEYEPLSVRPYHFGDVYSSVLFAR